MAFSMGCFACCVPCDPCDAVCDETPDEAFAVVYQVEDQRANLTWTGDAMGPIDGPWPGFESGSSFSQTITSSNVLLPGSRFPCYFRLKLWRNVGGGEGSDALDVERVTISCTQGKVNLGVVVLNAGESLDIRTDPENSTATYVIDGTTISLDTNGGDRHAHPPAFWQVSGGALCANTIVTVTASIQWSNDLIQHNLYGKFVECFDELPPGDPDDCLDCSGTPTAAPEVVYLTISNFDGDGAVDGNGNPVNYDGEYILDLTPTAFDCALYTGVIPMANGVVYSLPPLSLSLGLYLSPSLGFGVGWFIANKPTSLETMVASAGTTSTAGILSMLCGGASVTGSATTSWAVWTGAGWDSYGTVTFDYEFSL